MCQQTIFHYDGCRHPASKPARTTKCIYVTPGIICQQQPSGHTLSSETCPYCKRDGEGKPAALAKQPKHDKVLHSSWLAEQYGIYPKPAVDPLKAILDRYFEQAMGKAKTPENDTEVTYAELMVVENPEPEPEDKMENVIWDIPTRCFVDAGFARLDPWLADRMKLDDEAEYMATAKVGIPPGFEDFVEQAPGAVDQENLALRKMEDEGYDPFDMRGLDASGQPIYSQSVCPVEVRVELAGCCETKTELVYEQHRRRRAAIAAGEDDSGYDEDDDEDDDAAARNIDDCCYADF